MSPLLKITERLFQLAIIVFAILLPLEIVPNRLISTLSILVTLLLVPYPLARLLQKDARSSLGKSLSWVILLPLVSAVVSFAISSQLGWPHALIAFAVLGVRAWLVAQFAQKRHIVLFENVTLLVGLGVVAFGFYQFIGDLAGLSTAKTFLRATYSSHGTYGFPRVHSLAREPLLLANYLFLPMAIAAIRVVHKSRTRFFSAAFLLASGVLLISLDSRGAYLALLAATMLFTVSFATQLSPKNVALAILGVAFVGLVALGAISVAKGPKQTALFIRHALEHHDASFSNRSEVWKKSGPIFVAHPGAGVGLDNSKRYLNGSPLAPLPPDPPVFNNTYLTYATELGLIGIVLGLPLLYLLARFVITAAINQFALVGGAFALVLVAYAVQVSTYEALLNLRFWAVLGFGLAAYRLSTRAPRSEVS